MHRPTLSRRDILSGAAGLLAVARWPAIAAGVAAAAGTDITGQLARYMVDARTRVLPPEVMTAAKQRILDTLGAIVSGARLAAGEKAIQFARTQGGVPEASVFTTAMKT